ncbi:PEP-CTERM sorting domain-containing protein [Rubritalea spongiae]|uniref:PEP-CTERM sorting domain-containing protein n=1 Tax=Rubritalea spongiae TaxID=430797 RepID=A0ABW5E628_9BACT
MKIHTNTCIALGVLSFATSGINTNAAVIVSGGFNLDETQWVTEGYGDYGYIFFNNSASKTAAISTNISTSATTDMTYSRHAAHTVNASTQTGINAAVPIQNTAGTATDLSVGYWRNHGTNSSTFANVISFDMNTTASTLRIGVLVGAGGQSDGNADPRDYPSDIKLSDGTNEYTHTVIRPQASAAYQADWYFFDVTGIDNTTTLTVSATGQSTVSPNLNTPISGVVFSAIPEPSSTALIGLGSLALLARRRR